MILAQSKPSVTALARVSYQTENDKLDELVSNFLDDWETKARARGVKSDVDLAKLAKQNYRLNGAVPPTLPEKIKAKIATNRTKMETAYNNAISDYTKAKVDIAASAIELELRAFKSPIGLNPLILAGSWNVSFGEFFSADWTFGLDGKVIARNSKLRGNDDPTSNVQGKWSLDLEKS